MGGIDLGGQALPGTWRFEVAVGEPPSVPYSSRYSSMGRAKYSVAWDDLACQHPGRRSGNFALGPDALVVFKVMSRTEISFSKAIRRVGREVLLPSAEDPSIPIPELVTRAHHTRSPIALSAMRGWSSMRRREIRTTVALLREDAYRPLGVSPSSRRAETTQRALSEATIYETRMSLLREALFADMTDAAHLAEYTIALQNWARRHVLGPSGRAALARAKLGVQSSADTLK